MSWQAAPAGRWTGIGWSGSGALAGHDPYLVWADLCGMDGVGKPPGEAVSEVHVIVQLKPNVTAAAFGAQLKAKKAGVLNPLYTVNAGARASYCTATVNPKFFGLWALLGVQRYAISQARMTRIELSEFQMAEVGFEATRPLVGVIDDGLPFLHQRYRVGSGTRVLRFWDQGRDPGQARVLTRGAINTLLARLDPKHPNRASEAQLYAELGYARARSDETHGAAVMDLATGGANHDVVCVQLPVNTVADSSGASLAAQALDACHFILNQAQADQSVVINLSYGGQAGPHDGSGMLEAALDELLTLVPKGLAIVLAAGNSYESECHARIALPAKGSSTLRWRISSSDATETFMELWSVAAVASHPGIDIEVRPPARSASPAVQPGKAWEAGEGGLPWCSVVNMTAGQAGRGKALVAVGPTARVGNSPRDPAPPGLWEVVITNRGSALTLDAWIERDDPIYRLDIGGKQSVFEHLADPAKIESRATLSSVANGSKTIVVAAHVNASGKMAGYSASGDASVTDYREGPDVSAPGEESEFRPGVAVAGIRSGYTFRMGGTSVAAPQVTRLIADKIVAGKPRMDGAAIKAKVKLIAQGDEVRFPEESQEDATPERIGAGRLKMY